MDLALAEKILHLSGGLFAYAALAVIFYGIWRGIHRPLGHATGFDGAWMQNPWFYLVSSALFLGLCILGWKPLPVKVSPSIQLAMLVAGSLLYFPGMAFVLWGRLRLGRNYFVSSGFGAQLFTGHQLITDGPFAIVRHPMYSGLILAASGSLLIYTRWTTLFFACFAPFIILRAWREEQALREEFGEDWREYCQRVGALVPHPGRRKKAIPGKNDK